MCFQIVFREYYLIICEVLLQINYLFEVTELAEYTRLNVHIHI